MTLFSLHITEDEAPVHACRLPKINNLVKRAGGRLADGTGTYEIAAEDLDHAEAIALDLLDAAREATGVESLVFLTGEAHWLSARGIPTA